MRDAVLDLMNTLQTIENMKFRNQEDTSEKQKYTPFSLKDFFLELDEDGDVVLRVKCPREEDERGFKNILLVASPDTPKGAGIVLAKFNSDDQEFLSKKYNFKFNDFTSEILTY